MRRCGDFFEWNYFRNNSIESIEMRPYNGSDYIELVEDNISYYWIFKKILNWIEYSSIKKVWLFYFRFWIDFDRKDFYSDLQYPFDYEYDSYLKLSQFLKVKRLEIEEKVSFRLDLFCAILHWLLSILFGIDLNRFAIFFFSLEYFSTLSMFFFLCSNQILFFFSLQWPKKVLKKLINQLKIWQLSLSLSLNRFIWLAVWIRVAVACYPEWILFFIS